MIASQIGRRLLAILLPLVLLPMLLAALLRAQQSVDREPDLMAERAALESRVLASSVGARLAAAEASAWTLSRSAALMDRSRWRDQVVASDPFARVSVTNNTLEDDQDRPLVPIESRNPDDTAIVTFGAGEREARIFLVRALAGPRSQWAYFEIDPQWLWQDLNEVRDRLAVLDANGQWLFGAAQVPDNLRPVLGAAIGGDTAGAGTSSRKPYEISWQSAGREWRGAHRPVPRNTRLAQNTAWSLVVLAPSDIDWYAPLVKLLNDWPMMLLAICAALLLCAWLADRYSWPLTELNAAVLRIGQRQFARVDVDMPVELEPLAQHVNLSGQRVADELNALHALEEVDKLLLSNAELETALDGILARVQKTLRCRSVGLTLLDSDSPMFARVLVASDTTTALPVTRVALDRDFLEHISSTKDGVTVARCEEQRHSFLMPLQELGGQFFWVWAVRSGERLAALLAVAFTDAPQPDPRYATLGMEFAARLSIALSKSAHDEHLYRQAHYDPLTGLPNRVLFNQKLEADIRAAEAARATGALLYIDLDHFKKVNDTVGHLAGDQLLSIVSQRLRAIVKEGDTVARLAGDEFMVVLPRVDGPDAASMVADRLIESLALPVSLGGRDHYVQASIGIAFFPDDGSTVEELLRNADGAMYRAKDMGRGRAVFFDRKLAISQLDPTQSGLFRALRRREFSLYYQPQFSLADGRLTGLEALLRWQTPRDGTREPRSFIPAAEASGLIVDIGGWVLEAACAQLAVWREQGIAPPRLAINVSAQQLKYTEFPRTVRRVLDKFSLSPDLLELELTETVLADQAAGAALQQLSALGVRIALDDFGTGYSSLNYLRNHPIRAVKIDRSFLEEVPLNAASATLAETIITMAHALGKEVVAEGVETEEQMQFLRERGCDMAQGFYLARPMPVVQVSELLHARQDFLAPSPVRAAG